MASAEKQKCSMQESAPLCLSLEPKPSMKKEMC